MKQRRCWQDSINAFQWRQDFKTVESPRRTRPFRITNFEKRPCGHTRDQ
jgi:hypothetical protein